MYLGKKYPNFFPAGPFFRMLQIKYQSALIFRNLPCPEKFLVTRLKPTGINIRTQSNTCNKVFIAKIVNYSRKLYSQNSSIIDARLGSKYGTQNTPLFLLENTSNLFTSFKFLTFLHVFNKNLFFAWGSIFSSEDLSLYSWNNLHNSVFPSFNLSMFTEEDGWYY